MKKIFCATVAMVMTRLFVFANDGKPSDKADKESRKQIRKEKREERRELWLHSANPVTEAQFYYDFPKATDVSWTEGTFAEATFHEGTAEKTAYYDRDNLLVGTTEEVDYSILPAKAKEIIAKKYPDYSVRKVILLDDNENNDTNMNLFDPVSWNEDSYFPVLASGSKQIILNVTMDGYVSFVQDYK